MMIELYNIEKFVGTFLKLFIILILAFKAFIFSENKKALKSFRNFKMFVKCFPMYMYITDGTYPL